MKKNTVFLSGKKILVKQKFMKGSEVAVYIMGMMAVVMVLLLLLQMYMGE